MEYEITEDREYPGVYRVEAVNHAGDGEIYTAVFYGPRSKERAEEYAAWKASQEVDLEEWGRTEPEHRPRLAEQPDGGIITSHSCKHELQ